MKKPIKAVKKTAVKHDVSNKVKPLKELVVPIRVVRAPFGPVGVGEAPTRSGIMVYGNVLVGPYAPNSDLIIKAEAGVPVFTVVRPRVVQLQARQSDNLDFGFSDQFALMVIETAIDFVRFRIRRLDNGARATGRGQNLQVDIFCIDDGTEPSQTF